MLQQRNRNVPSMEDTPPNLSFCTSMFFERSLSFLDSSFLFSLYRKYIAKDPPLSYVLYSFIYLEKCKQSKVEEIISIKGDKL